MCMCVLCSCGREGLGASESTTIYSIITGKKKRTFQMQIASNKNVSIKCVLAYLYMYRKSYYVTPGVGVGLSGGIGFDTRSGNILLFLLPLFEEGQLSVTGESMCTKYWLTA